MKQMILAFLAIVATCGIATAHHFEKDGLVIKHPWTRATPNGASVGVGYLTITNNGKNSDRLTGGTFEGAADVEVHEMKMKGDTMMMRHLSDGLEIEPGETVKFSPGSYHLMFTGLKKPIAQGPNIKGSLKFEKAGSIDVTYKVESIGAMKSSDDMHGDMKMDDMMNHGKMH